MRKIFGTSTLHWFNKKSRYKIVSAALNNGFKQFDTSGVYGLGATNKYLGTLGLPKGTSFSAKLGLKCRKTFGTTRLEVLLRKVCLPKASRIQEDDCYSSWKKQFETQLFDLRVSKVQRLLIHERFITIQLWELFQKFLNEYKQHFEEYGVSASWSTLRPILRNIHNDKLLIQTTPEILNEKNLKEIKKLTLYGISNIYRENNQNIYNKKQIEGVIYFSSKVSRIKHFSF